MEVRSNVAAAGFQVADQGRPAPDLLEVIDAQLDADRMCDCQEMQYGVGTAPDRHYHRDGVLERPPGHDLPRGQAPVDGPEDRAAGVPGTDARLLALAASWGWG